MKVTIEQPRIVSLLYKQEKGDPDYGSCMWARFYLDLDNYTMSIEGDCGNYTYGWIPTPKSESFLQLLARMDRWYLLGKISSESVVDGDATWEAMEATISDAASWEGEELDLSIWEDIKAACLENGDDREIVDALKDALLPTDLFEKLDYEQTYGSIVHDYPTNAKKIVEVFDTCIRPKIRELMEDCENPKPLTIEELLQMPGEPVWIRKLDSDKAFWMLAYPDIVSNRIGYLEYRSYGIEWIAFRQKPKEV